MTRTKRLMFLLVGVLTAIYGAIAWVHIRQHDALSHVTQPADRDLVWDMSQLEVEYQRLVGGLNLRILAPQSVPWEELQLRHELFVSRKNAVDLVMANPIAGSRLPTVNVTTLSGFFIRTDPVLGTEVQEPATR